MGVGRGEVTDAASARIEQLLPSADGPCRGRERVQMIVDADGPWTSAARLVVDGEHSGVEHGVTHATESSTHPSG